MSGDRASRNMQQGENEGRLGFAARRFDRGVLIALVAVNLACFADIFPNRFVWDDYPLIVQDYHLRSLRHLGSIFTRDFFSHSEEEVKYGYFRPLITLSYLVDYRFWRLNPVGFHLTNLLFHAANCWLVYALARRLFPSAPVAGAGAAILFAVHPVHTESVAWISGRTDLICGFFFIFSLLCFLAFRTRGDAQPFPRRSDGAVSGGRGGKKYLILSLVSLWLALLAKEMAVIFPLLIFAYESALRRRRLSKAIAVSFPYGMVVVLYLAIRIGCAQIRPGPQSEAGWLSLPLSALPAFWLYVGKLLWPVGMSAYIRHPYVRNPATLSFAFVLSLSLLLVVWARRVGWNRTRSWIAVCFALSFLPLSNLIRISAPLEMGFPVAERFLYLPSIFAALFLAGMIPSLRRRRGGLGLVGVAVIVCWGALTIKRNAQWHDEVALFTREIGRSPDAFYLHAKLGEHYCREGRYGAGIASFERARTLHRRLDHGIEVSLLNNLTVAYRLAGREKDALRLLNEISRLDVRSPLLEYNRGMLLLGQQRLPEARLAFQRVLGRTPYLVDAWLGLAQVYQKELRFEEAVRCYREALSLFPGSAEIHNRLGMAYKDLGEYPRALEAYGSALALDRGHAAALANRGVVHALLGDFRSARRDLEAALDLQSELDEARVALGMVYAKEGDPVRARATFEEVLRRSPGNVEARLNRGILFYQTGDLAAARREFEEVLKLEPKHARARLFLRELERSGGGGPAPGRKP